MAISKQSQSKGNGQERDKPTTTRIAG